MPQYIASVDQDSVLDILERVKTTPINAVDAAKEAVRRSRRSREWAGKNLGDFDCASHLCFNSFVLILLLKCFLPLCVKHTFVFHHLPNPNNHFCSDTC